MYKGEVFRMRMVKEIAQRGGEGLIPGNIQGLVRWGPDLTEDVPAHSRALVLSNPHHSLVLSSQIAQKTHQVYNPQL